MVSSIHTLSPCFMNMSAMTCDNMIIYSRNNRKNNKLPQCSRILRTQLKFNVVEKSTTQSETALRVDSLAGSSAMALQGQAA